MKRLITAITMTGLILAAATCAQAQDGCVDSPENPTVIFGIITAAASFGLVRFRSYLRSRNK